MVFIKLRFPESSEDWKELKKHYVAAQKTLNDVRHVLSWKEMPNGDAITKQLFEAFMTLVAKQTVAHSEVLAKAKALLKTRA